MLAAKHLQFQGRPAGYSGWIYLPCPCLLMIQRRRVALCLTGHHPREWREQLGWHYSPCCLRSDLSSDWPLECQLERVPLPYSSSGKIGLRRLQQSHFWHAFVHEPVASYLGASPWYFAVFWVPQLCRMRLDWGVMWQSLIGLCLPWSASCMHLNLEQVQK